MKLWDKWNRTEGGYEWLQSGMLSSFCWCVIAFVGFFMLGVMWTE